MRDDAGWNLNLVEALEKLRGVVINVVDRHHDARAGWKRRIAVVNHHHLEIKDEQAKKKVRTTPKLLINNWTRD